MSNLNSMFKTRILNKKNKKFNYYYIDEDFNYYRSHSKNKIYNSFVNININLVDRVFISTVFY